MKLMQVVEAWVLLLVLFSCSSPMDEQVVKDYLAESPALTLYEVAYSDKKLPDCKEDFLGICYSFYCYKYFNLEVDSIEDFVIDGDKASCIVYLRPTNLTKAGEKLKDLQVNSTYKAEMKDGVNCQVVFRKEKGKWILVTFKSLRFMRTFWIDQSGSAESFVNLIGWDNLRNK
ncbi:hypothetical protein [Parabacteroides sp.]